MRLSKLIRGFAAILAFVAVCAATPAQSQWQQPAADLAAQIASILGHGTARLMIRNLSSLPVDEIPAIRKLLEQDLRARGVVANSAPNDRIIRVTLSESARGLTWVAEVIQGDDTQIAVVDLPATERSPTPAPVQFMLRREAIFAQNEPVLAALELQGSMILLTPAGIDVETHSQAGWTKSESTPIAARLPLARDPRGMILPTGQGAGFEAWSAGSHCTGSPVQDPSTEFAISCHPSDDLWPFASMTEPVTPPSGPAPNSSPPAKTVPPAPQIHAFYNAARDYFTGVVSPGMGVDLPPFYSAAVLPRASGTALLIGTIDDRVLLEANGKLTTISGTSDWGSDFALINSSCGTGNQIIIAGAASSAPGSPPTDSLRAYQVSSSDATPASVALAIDGTVTALWTAPDGKSVYAIIRNAQNQYEVDRVTALCD